MSEEYITLVSPLTDDPLNTSSRFTTRLPKSLFLKKEQYEIGLVDAIYPNTIDNLPDGETVTVYFNNNGSEQIRLPPGHYGSGQTIVDALNNAENRQRKAGTVGTYDVVFAWDSALQLISVNWKKFAQNERDKQKDRFDKAVKSVVLGSRFAKLCGFSREILYHPKTASRRPDLHINNSLIVVHCDIVQPSIFGSKHSKALEVLTLSGIYGDLVNTSFTPVRYHTIMQDEISEIRIDITTLDGLPARFSYGGCCLLLHVRPKSE